MGGFVVVFPDQISNLRLFEDSLSLVWSDALATNLAVFLLPGFITFSALELIRPLLDIVEAAAVPCGFHHQVRVPLAWSRVCVP